MTENPWRLFDDTGVPESLEWAFLLDGAEAAGRDCEREGLLELRNVHLLLLKVWITADIAARVELGSTSTVAVATADD